MMTDKEHRKKIRTAKQPEEDLRDAQELGAAFGRVLSGHERVLSGNDGVRRHGVSGDNLLCTGRHDTLKLHPHYSDARFKCSQSVYCVPERCGELQNAHATFGLLGLTYNYNDRLKQWDYDKWCAALDAASRQKKDTAAWLSALLSCYHGKKCIVEHVIAGVNHSNGFPWWAAGWREETAPRGVATEETGHGD